MAKTKQGDLLSCSECGLVVTVDEVCGCIETVVVCCDQPMAKGKPAADKAQSAIAPVKEICPLGRWRPAVRGFSASNLRSAMRLKAIAHVLAHTIAARISPNVFKPGQP